MCGLKLIIAVLSSLRAESHPAWVCGLKHKRNMLIIIRKCSHTLRGCVDWNLVIAALAVLDLVTPCVGVWIETFVGLEFDRTGSVTPCVGVWIETPNAMISRGLNPSHPAWVCGLKHNYLRLSITWWRVTPCVGVWIETAPLLYRSCRAFVTPCVGVWIETYRWW